MEWLRWHHGTVTDPKFQAVSRRSRQPVAVVLAVWACLLERASQEDERGSIEGFDCESMDIMLGVDDGSCCAVIAAMEDKGLICQGTIANWRKRQPKREDPTNADRQQAFRDRKRNAQSQENQHDNVTVTHGNASVTQDNARLDKIREEENIINTPPISPPRGEGVNKYPADFLQFWAVYPRKTGKDAALKSWRRRKDKPPTDELIRIVAEQKTWPQWTKDGGEYIPHASTWLNQGRWADELPTLPARASPPVQHLTPYQQQRKYQEELAAFALAANRDLEHGDSTTNFGGIGDHCHALPASCDPQGNGDFDRGVGKGVP